ncbi:hypothetical protein [Nonomuraea soli]|uniref:Uncharacterized protein n=1 Tax=Nonomuraea soli TaxID=1032476 RepID=A0A7W0HW13_9ACTN|nr:hypothetical protein [Nonomuraea soli]MBA2897773.1 hypothetical protein [Nonomuraea soli]
MTLTLALPITAEPGLATCTRPTCNATVPLADTVELIGDDGSRGRECIGCLSARIDGYRQAHAADLPTPF